MVILTRRITVVLAVAAIVFGLRMIPSPAPAQASCGGLPVISQICDVLSGGWNIAVGATKWQLQFAGHIVGWISNKAGQYACQLASGKLPIGAGAVTKMCDSIISKVTGQKSTGTTSASGSGGGGGSGSTASSSSAAAPPPQGSPAAALSTPGMAALAGAATLFVAHNISQATHVNVTSGFFPSFYSTMESIAWQLAVVAIIFGAVLAIAKAWMPTGELALLLGRVPLAGLLMLAVPVVTALAVGVVDALCGLLLGKFHGGITVMHVLAAALGILAGASTLAHLTGHATLGHVSGTGAWFLAIGGLVTAGPLALELILRQAAIYLSLLIVPLALVGGIFSPLTGWARGLLRVIFVLVVTKFILVLGLTLAGTLIASVTLMGVIGGMAVLLMVVLVPAALYGALIRVEQAWHAGMVGAIGSGPQASVVTTVRAAHARVRQQFGEPVTT